MILMLIYIDDKWREDKGRLAVLNTIETAIEIQNVPAANLNESPRTAMCCASVRRYPCHSAAQGCKQEMQELGINS